MPKARRPSIILATVTVTLLFVGAGCRKASTVADTPPEYQASPDASTGNLGLRYTFDEPVSVSIGESVVFPDGLTVTLTSIGDSRCPAGVACIWEGELAPTLDLSGGALTTSHELILGTSRGLWGAVGPYSLSASDVTEERMMLTVRLAGEGESAEAAVARFIADKYGKDPTEVNVIAEQDDGAHARGTVRFAPESSTGGMFLAAMVDGYWTLAYDGNGSVDCFVLRADLDFPDEMLGGFCDTM